MKAPGFRDSQIMLQDSGESTKLEALKAEIGVINVTFTEPDNTQATLKLREVCTIDYGNGFLRLSSRGGGSLGYYLIEGLKNALSDNYDIELFTRRKRTYMRVWRKGEKPAPATDGV